MHVADLVFSFDNYKLISALRDRGTNIAFQRFDRVQKQETVINDLFQDFEKLTRPTAAFITFEEEDARNLALEINTDK